MKFRIFLVVVVLLAIAAYLVKFQPDLVDSIRTRFVFVEVEAPPMERLTDFVDANANRIFVALDSSDSLMPTQEIKRIREDLLEVGKASSGDAREMYAAAVVLCDMLLEAASVREEHANRLDRVEHSEFDASLSQPAEREQVKLKKRAQFRSGIIVAWGRKADELRAKMRAQYSKLRQLELRVNKEEDSIRLVR